MQTTYLFLLILKLIYERQIDLPKIIIKYTFKCKSGKDESADIKFINFTCVKFRNCSSCVAQRNASKFNKTSIANTGLVTSPSNCVQFHGHALT